MATAKKAKRKTTDRQTSGSPSTTANGNEQAEVQTKPVQITDEIRQAARSYLRSLESLYYKLEEHEIGEINVRCSSPEIATEVAQKLAVIPSSFLQEPHRVANGPIVPVSIRNFLPDFLSDLSTAVATTHLNDVGFDSELLEAAESFLNIYANPAILSFETNSSTTDGDLAPEFKSFHERKQRFLLLLLGAGTSAQGHRITIEPGPRFFLANEEIEPGVRVKRILCTLGILDSRSFRDRAFSDLYDGETDPDRRVFGNHMQALKDQLNLPGLNWRRDKHICSYSGLTVRLNISRDDAQQYLTALH